MDASSLGKGACFTTLAAVIKENPDGAAKASHAVHDARRKVKAVVGGIQDLGLRKEILALLHREAGVALRDGMICGPVRDALAVCVSTIYGDAIGQVEEAQRRQWEAASGRKSP